MTSPLSISANWDAIVIGGGAAGLWAAGTAAARGKKILVLEKNNKPGVKILMSGGTRCNITHACSARQIAEAYGRQGRFLLSPLSRLTPEDVINQFTAMGVPSKVEETGKVFPVSDRAIDVRDALVKRLIDFGATLCSGVAVNSVDYDKAQGIFQVHIDGRVFISSRVLITTGGLSYAGCGTTGDGYAWLRKMGHTITPLRPALTPIVSSANWVHELSGITIPDCEVTAMPDGKKPKGKEAHLAQSRGGFLWTHFGCSGPTAMNVSKQFSAQESFTNACLAIDLQPDAALQDLQAWLEKSSHGSSAQRQISTVLSERLPKRLVGGLLDNAAVPNDTRMAELSNRHKLAILDRMKGWRIPVAGTRGYPKAEVTSGGVDLLEVDSQTMQSRLIPGLFLAGEILDLDGPIGGYNFQAAWSTGHTAGENL
jgi:predicted Rossmann fold flavoprotein